LNLTTICFPWLAISTNPGAMRGNSISMQGIQIKTHNNDGITLVNPILVSSLNKTASGLQKLENIQII
jgi:hypothetical protein